MLANGRVYVQGTGSAIFGLGGGNNAKQNTFAEVASDHFDNFPVVHVAATDETSIYVTGMIFMYY